MLLHVELGLEKHYTASRVLHAFGAIDAPRFIRAVGQKLRALKCQTYLDAIDALAWIECRQKNGRHNLYRFRSYRKELFQYPLAWVVEELRNRRLGEFAAREHRKVDADLSDRKKPRLKDALPDSQKSAKPSEGERSNEVVIYTTPKHSSAMNRAGFAGGSNS
ncbi:hypothetical protein [Pseudodonghicola sp.]|uniref:hypothetical protein n=1 Tax=Pseudodonghicola sp. TaxID=1969463 RepID=UPI003A980C18